MYDNLIFFNLDNKTIKFNWPPSHLKRCYSRFTHAKNLLYSVLKKSIDFTTALLKIKYLNSFSLFIFRFKTYCTTNCEFY